ncbi:MAG: hypothetical protein QOI57_2879 [Rubrobacteraceae bacterium]|nr:hypothetical protein [Rubrobacteraceae bacterium]
MVTKGIAKKAIPYSSLIISSHLIWFCRLFGKGLSQSSLHTFTLPRIGGWFCIF